MIDDLVTQQYNCVVIPEFSVSGNLPPGEHEATWEEFVERFAATPYRQKLVSGLQTAIRDLRAVGCSRVYVDGSFVTLPGRRQPATSRGCSRVYVDGSFVTAKLVPADYDCCWDTQGVSMLRLKQNHSPFVNFTRGRMVQKVKYGGEFFPCDVPADGSKTPFLRYFQRDKKNKPKGIIVINTGEVP